MREGSLDKVKGMNGTVRFHNKNVDSLAINSQYVENPAISSECEKYPVTRSHETTQN